MDNNKNIVFVFLRGSPYNSHSSPSCITQSFVPESLPWDVWASKKGFHTLNNKTLKLFHCFTPCLFSTCQRLHCTLTLENINFTGTHLFIIIISIRAGVQNYDAPQHTLMRRLLLSTFFFFFRTFINPYCSTKEQNI